MGREKAQGATTLKSWAEADAALGKIAALNREIAKKELGASEKKAQIDAKLKMDTAKPVAEKTALLHDLEAFAANNKETLLEETKGKKSIELQNGKLGFRKSTKLVIVGKIAKAIELIKAAGKAQAKMYISVKESVNREALKAVPDDELLNYGVRREVTDDFWCEPSEMTAKHGPGAAA